MNQDLIDYILIDVVKYIYLSEKSKKYKKKRKLEFKKNFQNQSNENSGI